MKGSSTDAVTESFWSKVFTIASSAVNFTLPLAHVGRIDPLVAKVAQEATFVPSLSSTTHQFGDEYRFFASRADFRPSEFGEDLWLGGPIGRRRLGLAIHLHVALRGNVRLGLVIDYFVGCVAFAVVHAKASGSPSKTVAFWPEILPVAGVAKHVSVVLGDTARIQHFSAFTTDEAELVPTLSKGLFLLGKVDIFGTTWTNTRHLPRFFPNLI